MNLSLGIVGLPNVGKSTLFNALTKKAVPAENYPFCTIDPNVGIVPVVDRRLDQIAAVAESKEIIPAVVEFTDIAGLVRGASTGQGLGNQFLSHIREVAGIVHVLRFFESKDILHVENSIDALRDLEIIQTELALKDLDTVSRRLQGMERLAGRDPKLKPTFDHLKEVEAALNEGKLAKTIAVPEAASAVEVRAVRRELQLLTDKPAMYLINVEADKAVAAEAQLRTIVGAEAVITCLDVKVESEIAALEGSDREEFMQMYGMEEAGLERLTRAGYKLLDLQSYFTAGPEEARAWTIRHGANAQEAAGTIHNDFIKGLIACEVVTADDFITTGGWEGAKAVGKMRLEAKTYIVKDGDVMYFRVNT